MSYVWDQKDGTRLPWWLGGKEPTCRCRRHREIPHAAEQLSLWATTAEPTHHRKTREPRGLLRNKRNRCSENFLSTGLEKSLCSNKDQHSQSTRINNFKDKTDADELICKIHLASRLTALAPGFSALSGSSAWGRLPLAATVASAPLRSVPWFPQAEVLSSSSVISAPDLSSNDGVSPTVCSAQNTG